MEQEVMLQKHPILQLSIKCRENRAHWQLESTASSPLNLKEPVDSAPLVISYALHASAWFHMLPKKKKKAKVKNQTKPKQPSSLSC